MSIIRDARAPANSEALTHEYATRIFGRKLGNTQIFEKDGSVTRVTVIEAGPVVVVGKRTPEKDGYTALVLGLEERKEKHTTQAAGGLLQKGERHAEALRSRSSAASADFAAKYEVGQP